jgi:putative endopeptidase
VLLRRLLASTTWFLVFLAAVALLLHTGRITKAADDTSSAHGFDTGNLDRTCKPCDDFYQFAMGGWMKKNTIPGEFPEWGSFLILAERNVENLHGILEASAKTTAAPGSNEQKIGDFYASCMDEGKVDSLGHHPIDSSLAAIAEVHDRAGLLHQVALLQSEGVSAVFNFNQDQDYKDSTQIIGEASQGGLGLPDRDYYTREDADSQKLRDQYRDHLSKLLELAGDSPDKASAEAKTILTIETSLAKASMTNVQLRDPVAVYHKMPFAQVKSLTPNLDWDFYLHALGVPPLATLNVSQPDFFKAVNSLLESVPLEDWKTYLRAHLVSRAAPLLSAPFVQEDFSFTNQILTGAKEIRPRFKRCIDATDANLGEALGQLYVRKYFPPESKARALQLVQNLISALHDDLHSLSWMSPETSKAAAAKLEAFHVKIGYPDKWRDYSALPIERGSYFENTLRAARFEYARQLAKIGKPVDRNEWGMTPPTVNAYYTPLLNEIVFPAGILQPPFYDPQRDDAYNYGAIGMVIGHEITHGFDDQGAQFDLKGNLRDWWTPEDLKNFQGRGDCIVNEFNGFVVNGDLHENGKLVEGESIADLGGLTIAYAAYKKSLEGQPQPKDVDGFTPDQRFFLGYAQVWGELVRPEFARLQANTDPHPLGRFRVLGPLSNLPTFASAFGCKKGDAMVREQACKIW